MHGSVEHWTDSMADETKGYAPMASSDPPADTPGLGVEPTGRYHRGDEVLLDAGADLLRAVLERLAVKRGVSLDSDADPGTPARNFELAQRLGIGSLFGIRDHPEGQHPRPWLCPEPRCAPLQNLKDGDYADIATAEPGQSWTCWGRMAEAVTFVYDGVEHPNDLNCCHYTPLKGLIRWQENAADWNVLASYYSMASKKVGGDR